MDTTRIAGVLLNILIARVLWNLGATQEHDGANGTQFKDMTSPNEPKYPVNKSDVNTMRPIRGHANSTAYYHLEDINIGVILPVHTHTNDIWCRGDIRGLVTLQRIEAFRFVIDEINRKHDLLPGLRIGYTIMDDCYSPATALTQVLKMLPRHQSGCYRYEPNDPDEDRNHSDEEDDNCDDDRDSYDHDDDCKSGDDDKEKYSCKELCKVIYPPELRIKCYTICRKLAPKLRPFPFPVFNRTGPPDVCDINPSTVMPYYEVAAVIGSESSTNSMELANSLQGYKVPVISYSAMASVMSNRKKYPFFYRSTVSDQQLGELV